MHGNRGVTVQHCVSSHQAILLGSMLAILTMNSRSGHLLQSSLDFSKTPVAHEFKQEKPRLSEPSTVNVSSDTVKDV